MQESETFSSLAALHRPTRLQSFSPDSRTRASLCATITRARRASCWRGSIRATRTTTRSLPTARSSSSPTTCRCRRARPCTLHILTTVSSLCSLEAGTRMTRNWTRERLTSCCGAIVHLLRTGVPRSPQKALCSLIGRRMPSVMSPAGSSSGSLCAVLPECHRTKAFWSVGRRWC